MKGTVWSATHSLSEVSSTPDFIDAPLASVVHTGLFLKSSESPIRLQTSASFWKSLFATLPVLLCLCLPGELWAQGIEYVKAHYTKHEYQVPMRDGARLFTAVYSPKDTQQTYPLLMIRTQSGL